VEITEKKSVAILVFNRDRFRCQVDQLSALFNTTSRSETIEALVDRAHGQWLKTLVDGDKAA
jgi:hypothetical protein